MRRLLATFWVCALALSAAAQEQLTVSKPEPALVSLGDSSTVTITVRGATARPQRPRPPRVPGLEIEISQPSQQSSISIINGRRTSDIRSTMVMTIRPTRAGRFEIPAFEIKTGKRTQTAGPIRIECQRDIRGQDRGFLELTAIPPRVYVNEPVQFVFDYGVDSRLTIVDGVAQGGVRYYDVQITAPWFDEPVGAVTVEGADDISGGDVINLVMNRRVQPAAYTENHPRGGASYNRFTFTRTFMPTEPGKITIDAPVMAFETGKTQRDFFGQRVGRTKRYFAYGEPLEVEVLPIPTEGRPANYGNAIGRFTVEASCDKQRVKVGDSVKLTLAIRGLGNTEFLEPPELGELDGFYIRGRNENRSRDLVEVIYDLTPLDANLTEIPSIAWSFFDTSPGVEKFVTVDTEPIALEVAPPAEGEGLTTLPGEEARAVVAGVDDIFDMKSIDAAVPVMLARPPSRFVTAALVLAPWLACLVLAALLGAHRRRRADVRGRRAAGAMKRFRTVLASGDPVDALAAYLADRLDTPEAAVIGPDLAERLATVGVEPDLAAEVQAAIDAGTAGRYGGGAGLDAERARALVGRLEPVRFALPRAATTVLAFLCLAAGVTAQGDSIAAAEEAYRDGDYATAAARFAAAGERDGVDRRVFYNLGNSLFRQGQFAEALVAYERARLALPRDPELLANIAVVQRKLELATGEGEPFLETLAELRDHYTIGERVMAAILANLLAAGLLVFGGRAGRWLGGVIAIPALVIAVEVVLLGPSRAPRAIVLPDRLNVVAEPREGLEPVLKLRRGVSVELVGETEAWASVRVAGRQGYVPADSIGVIR